MFGFDDAFWGVFFRADEVVGGAVQVAPDAAGAGASGASDENAWRRRHDQKDRELKAIQSRLSELEAADQAQRDAVLSEVEKQKQRADELKVRATAAERRILQRDIAAEFNLPSAAADFISGSTEDEMRESGEKLKELGVGFKLGAVSDAAAEAAVGGAVKVGSATRPTREVAVPIDDQIAAAQKAGNGLEVIRLKRAKVGLGIPAQS